MSLGNAQQAALMASEAHLAPLDLKTITHPSMDPAQSKAVTFCLHKDLVHTTKCQQKWTC